MNESEEEVTVRSLVNEASKKVEELMKYRCVQENKNAWLLIASIDDLISRAYTLVNYNNEGLDEEDMSEGLAVPYDVNQIVVNAFLFAYQVINRYYSDNDVRQKYPYLSISRVEKYIRNDASNVINSRLGSRFVGTKDTSEFAKSVLKAAIANKECEGMTKLIDVMKTISKMRWENDQYNMIASKFLEKLPDCQTVLEERYAQEKKMSTGDLLAKAGL